MAKKVSKKDTIKKAKQEIAEQIETLKKEKKETKDKERLQEIKKEISALSFEKNRIGKKDTYLSDVRKEMKLVRWPSAKEMVKYSVACLVFVLFFALFFYGIDAAFAVILELVK